MLRTNLDFLNQIRFEIDHEVNSTLRAFNLDHNAALRAQVLDVQQSCIPLQDNKLNLVIDSLVRNKVKYK